VSARLALFFFVVLDGIILRLDVLAVEGRDGGVLGVNSDGGRGDGGGDEALLLNIDLNQVDGVGIGIGRGDVGDGEGVELVVVVVVVINVGVDVVSHHKLVDTAG